MLITVSAYLGTLSIYPYCSSSSFSEWDIVLCPPFYTAVLWTDNLSNCVLMQPLHSTKCKFQFILFQLLPWVFRNKDDKIHKHSFLWEGSICGCQHGSFTSDCLGLKKYKKWVVEACFLNVTKCKTSSLWTTYKHNLITKFPNHTQNHQHLSIYIFKITYQKSLFPTW